MAIDLYKAATGIGRVECPRCGETVTRQAAPGRPGVSRVQLACSGLDCKWGLLVELDDGRAREVDLAAVFKAAASKDRQKFTLERYARPRCVVHGCGDRTLEAGLCTGHYALWRADRAGLTPHAWATLYRPAPARPPEAAAQAGSTGQTACIVDGCGRSPYRSDLCSAHAQRWKTHNPAIQLDEFLAIGGLSAHQRAQQRAGLAAAHQARPGNSTPPPTPTPAVTEDPMPANHSCRAQGCERPNYARGLCTAHYQRYLAFREEMTVGEWIKKNAPSKSGRSRAPGAAAPPASPATEAQAAEERVTAAALRGFTRVVLPTPAREFYVGQIGQFLTITDAAGRVLAQPLTA